MALPHYLLEAIRDVNVAWARMYADENGSDEGVIVALAKLREAVRRASPPCDYEFTVAEADRIFANA